MLKPDHTHHISELVNAHPVGLVPHRRLLVVFVNDCQVVLPYVTPGIMKGYQMVSLISLRKKTAKHGQLTLLIIHHQQSLLKKSGVLQTLLQLMS